MDEWMRDDFLLGAGLEESPAGTMQKSLCPEKGDAERILPATLGTGEGRARECAGQEDVEGTAQAAGACAVVEEEGKALVKPEPQADAAVAHDVCRAESEALANSSCQEEQDPTPVRLGAEEFAHVFVGERELWEVAAPLLERLAGQMPGCLFTLANARGVVLGVWGDKSLGGLEEGCLVNEYTPAIVGMTTALVTGRFGLARKSEGQRSLVCVSCPINDEDGRTLACFTVTSRNGNPYLSVVGNEAAGSIASQLGLRASLARESALVENSSEGLMAVDASGRIRRANSVARTMCGVSNLPGYAHLASFFCMGSLLEDIARGQAFSQVRVELYDRELEQGRGEYCLVTFVPGEDGGVLRLRSAREAARSCEDASDGSGRFVWLQTRKSASGRDRVLGESLRVVERELIMDAMRAAGGRVVLAAKALGIGKTTLYARLERYNLRSRDFRSPVAATEVAAQTQGEEAREGLDAAGDQQTSMNSR